MSLKPGIDLEVFNGLVGHIYDAATNLEQWPTYMQRLVDTLQAKSCLLRVQNLKSREVGIWISQGMDLEYQPKYREYYVHIDPLVPAISKKPVGTIIQTASFMSNTSFRRSEFYNDYARPQEKINVAGGFLTNNNDWVAVFGLHRPNGSDSYTQDEMAMLNMLTPHMQSALRINRHLEQLEKKTDAVGEILDQLPIGIVLVDTQEKPVFVNRMAMNLTLANNGLTVKADCMIATTRKDTDALQKLIFEAGKSESRQGGFCLIRHPVQAQSLTVQSIPINHYNGFDLGTDSNRIAAALFISSPNQKYKIPAELLISLYGLTVAEAKLATAIANGYSLETIAKKMNISKHTVRNHLKSCFNKTGVNRQAALVKLVLSEIPMGYDRP